jgi:hypothetical protein
LFVLYFFRHSIIFPDPLAKNFEGRAAHEAARALNYWEVSSLGSCTVNDQLCKSMKHRALCDALTIQSCGCDTTARIYAHRHSKHLNSSPPSASATPRRRSGAMRCAVAVASAASLGGTRLGVAGGRPDPGEGRAGVAGAAGMERWGCDRGWRGGGGGRRGYCPPAQVGLGWAGVGWVLGMREGLHVQGEARAAA